LLAPGLERLVRRRLHRLRAIGTDWRVRRQRAPVPPRRGLSFECRGTTLDAGVCRGVPRVQGIAGALAQERVSGTARGGRVRRRLTASGPGEQSDPLREPEGTLPARP